MKNNNTFWLCILIANMWFIASQFSDNSSLLISGFLWLALSGVLFFSSMYLNNTEFKLGILKREVEHKKWEVEQRNLEVIIGLLEKIAKGKEPSKKK